MSRYRSVDAENIPFAIQVQVADRGKAVRMAIACCQPMSMADRCQIAGELLDVLANIPTAYMQLISALFVRRFAFIRASASPVADRHPL